MWSWREISFTANQMLAEHVRMQQLTGGGMGRTGERRAPVYRIQLLKLLIAQVFSKCLRVQHKLASVSSRTAHPMHSSAPDGTKAHI